MSNSGRMGAVEVHGGEAAGRCPVHGRHHHPLMAKMKELYKKEKGAFPDPDPEPAVGLYGPEGQRTMPLKVAKAINGYFLEDVTIGDKTYKKGECVPGFAQPAGRRQDVLRHAGSFAGAFTAGRHQPHGPQEEGRSDGSWALSRMGAGPGRSTGASSTTGPRWIRTAALGIPAGRSSSGWTANGWAMFPDGPWPPLSDKEKGKLPFIMKPDGVASLFGPGLARRTFPRAL